MMEGSIMFNLFRIIRADIKENGKRTFVVEIFGRETIVREFESLEELFIFLRQLLDEGFFDTPDETDVEEIARFEKMKFEQFKRYFEEMIKEHERASEPEKPMGFHP